MKNLNIELREVIANNQHNTKENTINVLESIGNKSVLHKIQDLLKFNSISCIKLYSVLEVYYNMDKISVILQVTLYANGKDCDIAYGYKPYNENDKYSNDMLNTFENELDITNSRLKQLINRLVMNFITSSYITSDYYKNDEYKGLQLTNMLQNGYLASQDISFKYKGNKYKFYTSTYDISYHTKDISYFNDKLTIENIILGLENI